VSATAKQLSQIEAYLKLAAQKIFHCWQIQTFSGSWFPTKVL